MHQPLRVAMIIQGYYPRLGGAERQLGALAPELQARGVEVRVLTRRYPGLAPFERVAGVPVHRLPIPGPRHFGSAVFTLAALPLLRRLRPHLIHAHELLSPTTAAIAAKRALGLPVVAKVLRGGTLGDLAKLRRNPLSARRIPVLRQQVDVFIAISQEIDEELAEIGVPPERRIFIPNGVDTGHFAPPSPADRRALRAALDSLAGAPPTQALRDAPIVVFAGRLAAEKRVDQLLALWPQVRAVHGDAQLVVIGAGEEEAALRRMAGEGVHFLGYCDDVAPFLRAADVFVLPSATEGLSNALLEAMAAGLPVIATEVGGTPDVIEHGVNGWLVPPDDPPALQAALLKLLGDVFCRAGLARRARERVLHDYSLPVVAERLRTLYHQVIEGASLTELAPLGKS